VRVLIVDDHPMVREGLRSMLEPAGVRVVGEAGTGEGALRAAAASEPEVVLLDLELPDLDGLAVLRRLKARAPDTAVLVITMHDDPALVRRAVEAGASGYVLKGVGRRELLAAVEADDQDARYFYFLGLARWALDNRADAKADFEDGARLERANRPGRKAVSTALERVQGPARQAVNGVRP